MYHEQLGTYLSSVVPLMNSKAGLKLEHQCDGSGAFLLQLSKRVESMTTIALLLLRQLAHSQQALLVNMLAVTKCYQTNCLNVIVIIIPDRRHSGHTHEKWEFRKQYHREVRDVHDSKAITMHEDLTNEYLEVSFQQAGNIIQQQKFVRSLPFLQKVHWVRKSA